MYNFYKNYSSKFAGIFFLVAIFLLRLPPLLFIFNSSLFSSHNIARYLLILSFFLILYLIYKRKFKFHLKNGLTFIILLYFLTQTSSIFGATNIQAFLFTYKDIVFGILVYLIGSCLIVSRKNINNIISVLLFCVSLNLAYQFIIYFFPDLFKSLLVPLIYPKYLQIFDVNLPRQKYFVDIFDVALIPIIFYLLTKHKKIISRAIAILMIASVSFFVFVSNFRIHLLMMVISVAGIVYVAFDDFKKRFLLLTVILVIFYTVGLSLFNLNASTSVQRLFSSTDFDYATIESRFTLWKYSIDMGLSSPLFGVGLGNFYDLIPQKRTVSTSLIDPKNKLAAVTLSHPHNLFFQEFAETGVLGLLGILLLVCFFGYYDFKIFVNGKKLTKLLIISFWSLFSFGLLAPPNTPQYISLFWLLRVLIEKSESIPDLQGKTRIASYTKG